MDDTNIEVKWATYWNSLLGRFNNFIRQQEVPEAIRYIQNSIALYAWITEDISSKLTRNQNDANKLNLFLVQGFDLLRGSLHFQKNILLAPAALSARTAFEGYCNLKFMLSRNDVATYIDRFHRFSEVEKIIGQKNSINLPDPTQEEIDNLLLRNPEWRDPGRPGKIQKKPHWSAEPGMNLRKVATLAGIENEYLSIYPTTSKFTHVNPIAINLYTQTRGLGPIPDKKQVTRMTLFTTHFCINTLQLYCKYFGVEFPELDYAHICQDFITLSRQL